MSASRPFQCSQLTGRRIFVVWPDPEVHIPDDTYGQYLAHALARQGAFNNIWLDAESYLWGVLSSPVVSVQVIRLKVISDKERSKLIPIVADWTSRSRKCEGYRDHWFNATINVDGEEFMVLTGWDSIEVCPAYHVCFETPYLIRLS